MKVHKPGARVSLGGSIEALVTAIAIRDTGVTYQAGWFDDRSYKCDWFSDFEVSAAKREPKLDVGFHK